MAGTAIAVALVPPVRDGAHAAAGSCRRVGLVSSANLLGILIGGISVLPSGSPTSETNCGAALPAAAVAGPRPGQLVGFKLYGRYEQHLYALKRDNPR